MYTVNWQTQYLHLLLAGGIVSVYQHLSDGLV